MAKVIRKSNKRTLKRTLKRTNKNKKNNSRSKVMRGGDDGRYVLPPSYFGGKKDGYVSDFTPLSGAVSQGTVSAHGKFAGPNLYPQLTGGGCGCGKKSKNINKSKKSQKSRKSRKSKSKNNKRH